jgi:hypothetical protein
MAHISVESAGVSFNRQNRSLYTVHGEAQMKRPIAVWMIATLYLLVGVIGFVHHFPELTAGHGDAMGIEVTELLAVIAGAGLLLRQNWARWLALAWIVFHVGLSFFHPLPELLIHTAICILIAWLLFRPATSLWFKEAKSSV